MNKSTEQETQNFLFFFFTGIFAKCEQDKIQQSETRICNAVFLNSTNHYDTLFSGTAMHLMDEVPVITTTFTLGAIDENKKPVKIS